MVGETGAVGEVGGEVSNEEGGEEGSEAGVFFSSGLSKPTTPHRGLVFGIQS